MSRDPPTPVVPTNELQYPQSINSRHPSQASINPSWGLPHPPREGGAGGHRLGWALSPTHPKCPPESMASSSSSGEVSVEGLSQAELVDTPETDAQDRVCGKQAGSVLPPSAQIFRGMFFFSGGCLGIELNHPPRNTMMDVVLAASFGFLSYASSEHPQ